MNLPLVGNELARSGRVRADCRDPNNAGRVSRHSCTETSDSPEAGRWSGRHPRDPARTRRRTPRARLRPNASARVPVRSAPAADEQQVGPLAVASRLLSHESRQLVAAVARGCVRHGATAPSPSSAPLALWVGTRVGRGWEQIASPRGSSCPLMSFREAPIYRRFRVGRGVPWT
jgi:hypothetical protein